jgi:hypothetical protein
MPHLRTVRYCLRMAAVFVPLLLPLRGGAQPLITSDALLNTGNATTDTGTTNGTSTNPFVPKTSDTSIHLWQLLANPWGVSNLSSGSTTISYSGTGSVVTTVNYTGVSSSGVSGYPFVLYGGDPYNSPPINSQGPTFPAQISSMSSLIADVSYTLSLTNAPGNLDVGYDEWIIPSATYHGGIPGALEVFIAPYFNFGGACSGGGANFVGNFDVNVTLNGSTSLQTWKEYAWGSGPGNEIIFCPGGSQISSGEVRFNLLDFINQAISTNGHGSGGTVTSSWYVAGIEYGTEWGNSTSPNYTLTSTKIDIEQTTGSKPAPPTNLTSIVH